MPAGRPEPPPASHLHTGHCCEARPALLSLRDTMRLLSQDLFFHQMDIRVTSCGALPRQQNKDANKSPGPPPGPPKDAEPPASPAVHEAFEFKISFSHRLSINALPRDVSSPDLIMPELKGSVLFPAADNLLLNGPITRQPGLCLAAQRRGRLPGR